MTYTVVWKPAAEAELAELWMTAADKPALAQAANEIDDRLAKEPIALGESRSGSTRVWFVGPLGVTFEIREDDRLVRVIDVWSTT
jgi:plasmid stabilization system protein ParE